MRVGRYAVAVALSLLLVSGAVSAETDNIVIGPDDYTSLGEPDTTTHWAPDVPWWDLGNYGRGFAAAKDDGWKTRLEAQSICEPGRSNYRADAKAVWRFDGGHDGWVFMRPQIDVWGQLITYPTPFTGTGEGKAKLTVQLRDTTADDTLIDENLLDESSPALVRDTLVKHDPLTNTVKQDVSKPFAFRMYSSHHYELEIKLWTSCWTYGLYSTRVDFSRRSISTESNPLIGMVLIKDIGFVMD